MVANGEVSLDVYMEIGQGMARDEKTSDHGLMAYGVLKFGVSFGVWLRHRFA
jgi:hypothetical protein